METTVPDIMNIEDAAAYLRVHRNTIRRYIADGKLPASQILGRRGPVRIRRLDLDALLVPFGPAKKDGAA